MVNGRSLSFAAVVVLICGFCAIVGDFCVLFIRDDFSSSDIRFCMELTDWIVVCVGVYRH